MGLIYRSQSGPDHRGPVSPQVVGVLDLVLVLLQASPTQESLSVFLLEPGNLEVLLALLVRPKPLPLLPEQVCRVRSQSTPEPGADAATLPESQGSAAGARHCLVMCPALPRSSLQ